MPTPLPEHYGLVAVWRSTETDGSLYHPEGIDVGPDGLIYVAERGHHRVSVWHANGQPEARWGQQGAAPGQFQAPEDVAVDGQRRRLYVADTGNRRVQVLDRTTGAPLASWDQVGLPRGIATDADGRVYVADAEGHRILVFSPDGERLATWGGPGKEPGRFDTPLGLSTGPDGLLYVADSGNQRVQWLDDGQVVGTLSLDNTAGPGGMPTDVGVDQDGNLYVAVARGVLHFRRRSSYAETILPVREVDDPNCPIPQPGRCKILVPLPENHEGIRRLAVTPAGGLYFSYAPALRYGDAVFARAARDFPRLVGGRQVGPHWRRTYDPRRIDAGAEPYYAHVLDTSGLARVYRAGGQWYDGLHAFLNGPGVDIAADLATPEYTAVLTGNQVTVAWLRDFARSPPTVATVLDPQMMTRRDRTGSLIPDQRWWLTALAMRAGVVAVLNTGYQQLVVRERATGRLVAAAALNRPSAPFRAFRDVVIDVYGNYWVLARDGSILPFNAQGQRGQERKLQGLGGRTAEALAVLPDGQTFVLTGDGWIFKHDAAGRLRAAWEIAAAAGPGRYRDLTVDDQGRVLVPDGAADRILVFGLVPGEGPPPPPAGGEPCQVTPEKRANPTRLLLGETTQVSLQLAASCGPADMLDIVLVADTSCQMGGDRLAALRQGGEALVEALGRRDRLALVTFNDRLGGARLRVPLTDDRTALADAVGGLELDCLPPFLDPTRRGDGRMSDGLRTGREALFGPASREGAGKVLVLVSSSILDREIQERQQYGRWIEGTIPPAVTEREHASWEAWQLWEAGAKVYTVGVDEGDHPRGPPPEPTPDLVSTHPPDEGLLASIASPAEGYRFAAPDELPAVLDAIGRELSDRRLFETLTIEDRLPANMRLVAGSANIPPEILPDGALRWRFSDVGLEGPPVLTYRVEPLEAGWWPTNVEAVATYRDGRGFDGQVVFPIPRVQVLAPTPTATPSPTPTDEPTPTFTTTPTATPTASATPSPTPSPTATPHPVYLPIAYRQICQPKVQPLDVALVIDTSSSMAGAKLEAASQAARALVGLLELPRDRAAVITFNNRAELVQDLTGDRSALERALVGLTTAVGTRIDLGLWLGLDTISGPNGRPEAQSVLILLTDGRPQGGTEGSTRTAAAIGHQLGVVIYTIGLGADVDPNLLTEIAGHRARMYLAPDAADLARIYREVARLIPCY